MVNEANDDGVVPSLSARTSATSLKSLMVRGSAWMLLSFGLGQVLRLVGNLVLWRLLYPEAFGIMAIVNVFLTGLGMFSDVGIGPSIIQNKQGDDPSFLNTAWTIQVVRGALLLAACVAAALPISHFYHQPMLAWLIPIAGLGSAISGFNSTKLFTATRSIALGRLTVIDLAAQVSGLVVMLALAYATRSIWALTAAGLVGNLVRLVMGHVMLPGISNHFHWDRQKAVSLLHFGRWIFVSTLLTFAAMQSDRVIFGKLVTMQVLGVYSVATVWATLPTSILNQVFQSVLFPVLSKVRNQGAEFPRAFRETRAPGLIAAGWLSACMLSGGPTLIRFLYDDRALDAGWMVQLLSLGTWLLALENTNGCALLACGKAKWVAAGSGAKVLGMFVFIPLGMTLYGFPGAVFGFALSELCRYAVSLAGTTRIKLQGYRQDGLLSCAVALSTACGLVVAGLMSALSANRGLHQARWVYFLDGAAIFVTVSMCWAVVYQVYRRRRRGVQSALDGVAT
jgi:O-antigen/teichoic acid export membrane protein